MFADTEIQKCFYCISPLKLKLKQIQPENKGTNENSHSFRDYISEILFGFQVFFTIKYCDKKRTNKFFRDDELYRLLANNALTGKFYLIRGSVIKKFIYNF